MIYNKLGKTDLTVSRLGFGLMRLPLSGTKSDFSHSTNLITSALKRGINYFDVGTFYCNGYCEEAFGKALNGRIKNNLIFSGKNSSHQNRNQHWNTQLNNTLNVFNTNKLDVYILHYLDLETWKGHFIANNVIEQIQNARNNGNFKYLGFSSHDNPENIKLLIDTNLFDVVIIQYNLLETKNKEIIKYASKKGLGVIIMNPLAGGILANNDNFPTKITTDIDIRKASLKYLFNNPDIHCVLSGMKNISEIIENINTMKDLTITDSSINELIIFLNETKKTNKIFCTNCYYCLPCTQGINIPEIIDIYNKYGYVKNNKLFSREYSLLEINACSCIECGICENKCPNNIDIMRIMKESVRKYYD